MQSQRRPTLAELQNLLVAAGPKGVGIMRKPTSSAGSLQLCELFLVENHIEETKRRKERKMPNEGSEMVMVE